MIATDTVPETGSLDLPDPHPTRLLMQQTKQTSFVDIMEESSSLSIKNFENISLTGTLN